MKNIELHDVRLHSFLFEYFSDELVFDIDYSECDFDDSGFYFKVWPAKLIFKNARDIVFNFVGSDMFLLIYGMAFEMLDNDFVNVALYFDDAGVSSVRFQCKEGWLIKIGGGVRQLEQSYLMKNVRDDYLLAANKNLQDCSGERQSLW